MSKTILLADDSPTIQKVVELTFVDGDYEVVAVSNGDELLAKLPETGPDIVVCDVIMPGTDGYDVCQQIKSDPGSLHIPVILLTGTFEPFDRDRAIAAGCSEIITKPFEARKLVEVVERLTSGQDPGVPAPEPERAEQFEGAIAPPPGGVASPPAAAFDRGGDSDRAEYGTMLAPPPAPEPDPNLTTQAADEDALDFTASGFAEMEAAADKPSQPMTPPEHGLEFEPSEPEPAADETARESETTQPIPGEAIAEASAPFSEPDDDAGQPAEAEDPFAATGDPFESPEAAEDDPFASSFASGTEDELVHPDAVDHNAVTGPPPSLEDDPTAVSPASQADQAPESPFEADPRLADTDGIPEPEPEPEPAAAPEPWSEIAVHPEPETEAEPAPVVAAEPPAEFDTPLPSPPPAPQPGAVPVTPPPAASEATPAGADGRLSDEEVERIARRVVELASDTLERISWEILPDMAEMIVRQRLRELEGEVEAQAREPN